MSEEYRAIRPSEIVKAYEDEKCDEITVFSPATTSPTIPITKLSLDAVHRIRAYHRVSCTLNFFCGIPRSMYSIKDLVDEIQSIARNDTVTEAGLHPLPDKIYLVHGEREEKEVKKSWWQRLFG